MNSPSSPAFEVEVELKDAGNKLLQRTSSIVELLSLLDKAEKLLLRVEQAPSRSLEDAMLPLMKALICPELLSHTEIDVKASVLSCLHEITRITAPDAPYDDEKMKEIFQLTVLLFEKLPLASGHCYTKAVFILDTMAKVRSCLVMLDIEVDELIVEMFQKFFEVIRPHHPECVFPAMETIMVHVTDEIEEIPLALLSLLLASVKKGNQNVSPLSYKLGENVFKKCAAKLKPYLPEGLRLTGSDVNDYAEIVSSLCQDGPGRDSVALAEEPVPDATGSRDDSTFINGSSRCITSHRTPHVEDTHTLGGENTGKTLALSANQTSGLSKGHNGNSNSSMVHVEDNSASPSQYHSFPEGTHRKRGRPKKKKDSTDLAGDASRESSGQKMVSFSASRSRNEDESLFEKTSKKNGKREHTPHNRQFFKMPRDVKKYGEQLIGCRLKVWWPLDERFYKGVIYSFNPVERKHRVLYTDGEEELLDLSKERWAFVGKNNLPDLAKDTSESGETEHEEQKDDSKSKKSKAINKSKCDNSQSSKDQSIHIDGKSVSSSVKDKKKIRSKASDKEVRKRKSPDSIGSGKKR